MVECYTSSSLRRDCKSPDPTVVDDRGTDKVSLGESSDDRMANFLLKSIFPFLRYERYPLTTGYTQRMKIELNKTRKTPRHVQSPYVSTELTLTMNSIISREKLLGN